MNTHTREEDDGQADINLPICLCFICTGHTPEIFIKPAGPKGLRAESARAFTALVAGAWTERKKMYHGGSFLELADDNMDIQNPEAQNRELSGF